MAHMGISIVERLRLQTSNFARTEPNTLINTIYFDRYIVKMNWVQLIVWINRRTCNIWVDPNKYNFGTRKVWRLN